MQQQLTLRLKPSEANDEWLLKEAAAVALAKPVDSITGFSILKRSVDARAKNIWVNITIQVYVDEPYHQRVTRAFHFKDVSKAYNKVIIIGAGPAGLFAALSLIQQGIKPVILERGKDVRARRRDLAVLNKQGEVNPESNYCFGEGGAGTYSDGKLYTRSTKRGSVDRILQLLFYFGAEEKILYESHPHIGTNKLPQIIMAMRRQIIECGGEIRFDQKVTDFELGDGTINAVVINETLYEKADGYILATGHSARDIFRLLYKKKVFIEAKPFALGVRVEHPQALIDGCQYHLDPKGGGRSEFLPPASYSLVHQAGDRGVFSFCMCPGGIIAPAATDPGELVVNGWSPSKRNNPFANSGIVVEVSMADAYKTMKDARWQPLPDSSPRGWLSMNNPLLLMNFQQMVEQKAFAAGGGKFVAPAQRMIDFTRGNVSASLPDNSYLPGLAPADLRSVLPPFVFDTLVHGFKAFGQRMPAYKGRSGYFTNEAVIVATESRTSSPVRIPRDSKTLAHPQLSNLYPCGEGGGYAGGIVSAAMDGERVAEQLSIVLRS